MKPDKQKNAPPCRARKVQQPRFLAVDFFCGAGGTTRGLIDAGGYIIAGVDKDRRCEATYVDNNTNEYVDYCTPRYLKYDIFPQLEENPQGQQEALFSELGELIPYYKGKAKRAPMLFAICAPCQPFTKLSHKALSDKRRESRKRDSSLLSEAAKFVEHFQPELVLSENVAGIGKVWDEFRMLLHEAGYCTGTKLVCTSKFGIPQYRKRYILMAVREDLIRPDRLADIVRRELVVPDHDPDEVMLTVREAIGHLPAIAAGQAHSQVPNHRTRSLSETNLRRLTIAKPGETNAYMEQVEKGELALDCHKKVNGRLKTRCFNDVYTRMSPDRPSPTITTKCHSISNGRYGHYDMSQVRGISLREAAILQSFPERYEFYPENMIEPVARMIGNAVPPKLAKFYATHLVGSLRDELNV